MHGSEQKKNIQGLLNSTSSNLELITITVSWIIFADTTQDSKAIMTTTMTFTTTSTTNNRNQNSNNQRNNQQKNDYGSLKNNNQDQIKTSTTMNINRTMVLITTIAML